MYLCQLLCVCVCVCRCRRVPSLSKQHMYLDFILPPCRANRTKLLRLERDNRELEHSLEVLKTDQCEDGFRDGEDEPQAHSHHTCRQEGNCQAQRS